MRALLLLGVLCVPLAATLALELMLPAGGEEDAAAATGIRAAPRLPRLDATRAAGQAVDHSDAWVATILARPLFSRDRRPPDAKVAAAGEVTEGPPRLTGIAVGPGQRRAIFAGSAGGKPIVVSEGGTVGAFTVRAIRPDAVQLVGPGGARTLSPAFDPSLPTAAPDQPMRLPGFPALPLAPGAPLQLPGRPFMPPRFNGVPYNVPYQVPGRFNPAGGDAPTQP